MIGIFDINNSQDGVQYVAPFVTFLDIYVFIDTSIRWEML